MMKRLSPAERGRQVRALKEAQPAITKAELARRFGVTPGLIALDLDPEAAQRRRDAMRSPAPYLHRVTGPRS